MDIFLLWEKCPAPCKEKIEQCVNPMECGKIYYLMKIFRTVTGFPHDLLL